MPSNQNVNRAPVNNQTRPQPQTTQSYRQQPGMQANQHVQAQQTRQAPQQMRQEPQQMRQAPASQQMHQQPQQMRQQAPQMRQQPQQQQQMRSAPQQSRPQESHGNDGGHGHGR
jgi:hypothetical protein